MPVTIIDHKSPLLKQVISLHRKNAKTLGHFPYEAFNDHARKNCIICFEEDKKLIGYLLFRVTYSKHVVFITHLCIDKNYRGSGIPKALLDKLISRYKNFYSGIYLNCRDDYKEATKLWKSYGFVPKQRKKGRGKDEKPLTTWFYDFGNAGLFGKSLFDDSKIHAVLDVNILIKKRDSEGEIMPLFADWLINDVEYFFTKETYQEINRDNDVPRANKTAIFLNDFHQITIDVEKEKIIYESLLKILPNKTDNQQSDIKQISQCISSGNEYFISLDEVLLNNEDNIRDLGYNIFILRPADFIRLIDKFKNALNYQKLRVAGANFYESKNLEAGDIEELAENFLSKNKHEKKQILKERLNKIALSPTSTFVKIIKEAKRDSFFGLVAGCFLNDTLEIEVLRVNHQNGSIEKALFQQLIYQTLLSCISNNVKEVSIVELQLQPYQIDIIHSFGFITTKTTPPKTAYFKALINETLNSTDLEDLPSLKKHFDNSQGKITFSPEKQETIFAKTKIERIFWPLKLADNPIPCYIIPIRTYWASQLFDYKTAENSLFGSQETIMWSRENVYYRSVFPVMEQAPGRILWYVSSDNKERGRSKAIVATSYLDEVIIDKPKSIFKTFKNYGTYAWKDIFSLAKQDLDNEIKALKFSDTEVFDQPIYLEKIGEILSSHGMKRNTFASPLKVPNEVYIDIYKMGKNG